MLHLRMCGNWLDCDRSNFTISLGMIAFVIAKLMGIQFHYQVNTNLSTFSKCIYMYMYHSARFLCEYKIMHLREIWRLSSFYENFNYAILLPEK